MMLLRKIKRQLQKYPRDLSNQIKKRRYFKDHQDLEDTSDYIWDGSYESLFQINNRLIEPAIKHIQASDEALDCFQWSSGGRHLDRVELITRTCIGIGFSLFAKPNQDELKNFLIEQISNGTNPRHPQYFGLSNHMLVENPGWIIALLLNRELFDEFDKEQLHTYIHKFLSKPAYPNNWQWFKIFHALFLEEFFSEDHSRMIEESLHLLNKMHLGRGWYSDGLSHKEVHIDYYASWAMQYYPNLFRRLSTNQKYEWFTESVSSRLKSFCEDFQDILPSEGLPPLFGRSQTYRFALMSAFAFYIEDFDEGLNEVSDLKYRLQNCFNSFIRSHALSSSGHFNLGVKGAEPDLVEHYSGGGSPYWALKFFAFLLIPPENPFWSSPSKLDSSERIRSIQQAGLMMVRGERKSFVLNAAINNNAYATKYNKLAFESESNDLAEITDKTLDHSFVVGSNGKRNLKRKILSTLTTEDMLAFRFEPEGQPSVEIETCLAPSPGGYRFKHSLIKGQSLDFEVLGSSHPKAKLEIESTSQRLERINSNRVRSQFTKVGDSISGRVQIS